MNPLPRRLIALKPSCIKAPGPLYSAAPIGRFCEANPASRRLASNLQNVGKKQRPSRRWTGAKQGVSTQIGLRARFQHTWEKIATSPKRSNTTPLLGAVFGATALAYVGKALVSHEQEEENPIKSTDGLDTPDEDGKSGMNVAAAKRKLTYKKTQTRYD